MVLSSFVCAETVRRLVSAVGVDAAAARLEVGVGSPEEWVYILASSCSRRYSGIRVWIFGCLARVWSSSE